MRTVKHSQSFQNGKFAMSLKHIKKVRDEVDFLHVDKNQSFLQIDCNTLGIKISRKVILSLLMDMIKYSQSTQSNNFANLYNISKKKLRMEFIFCTQISFYKLALLFLMEEARHVQSTQNRKLVILLQYIKKKILQLLLCSIVMQNVQKFHGGPVIFDHQFTLYFCHLCWVSTAVVLVNNDVFLLVPTEKVIRIWFFQMFL